MLLLSLLVPFVLGPSRLKGSFTTLLAAFASHFTHHHAANRERNNKNRKARYGVNGAEQKRAWNLVNNIRARSNLREWRAKNGDKVRFWDKAKAAQRRGAEGTFTAQELRIQYGKQSGLCFWCHVEVNNKFHADHLVPLSRGGTNWIDNIVVACPTCNNRKYNLMPDEWLKRLHSQCATKNERSAT